MKLSAACSAINTLCLELRASRGAQPPSPSPYELSQQQLAILEQARQTVEAYRGARSDPDGFHASWVAAFCGEGGPIERLPPRPRNWITVERAKAVFQPLHDLAGEVGRFVFGIRERGKSRVQSALRLNGWWCQFGGNPPVFLPHSITPEELQALYGDTYRGVPDQEALRVWFDEADEIDPVKWERLDPLNVYMHPRHTGAPGCDCPDCRRT